MEVHLDSTEAAMSRRDHKGKRRRPQGRAAAPPAEVAAQTGRVLADREAEWLGRLSRDPASFAAVERRGPRPSDGTRPTSMSPASWPRLAASLRWPSMSPP